jgi:predicted permease
VRTDATTESATLAVVPPLAVIQGPSERLAIDGYTPRIGEDVAAQFNTVGTDYFSTLRISLVAGREFEESDNETGAPVVIVNGTFAERFWGSAREAVGRRIRVADDEWRTVIGVAADVKYERINESPRPYFYLPFDQAYRPIMFMHTRGRGDPAALVARARTHVAALDPGLQLVAAAPLADVTRISLMFFQITATMLFVFGAAGMMLAAIGMYGLVSYTVTQRTREIGIRMALGATARSVIRAFVGRSLRLGATGAIVGLVVALATSRFLASQLFGVTATDGSSFAAALAVVFGGVIAATIVPAWRAARTNPVVALRHH